MRSIFQATRRKASGSAAIAALLANVLCRRLGVPRGRHRRAAQSQSANRTPSRSHNSIIRHGLQCLDQKLPATTVAEMCRLYFSTSEFGHHFSRQISVTTSAARCRSPLQPPDFGNHFQTQWQNEQSQHPQWQNEQSHTKPTMAK